MIMESHEWDRISGDYDAEIISPFHPEVINPLTDWLDAVPSPGKKTVVELGCGTGPLVPRLSRFKRAVALDFSAGMLEEARRRDGAEKVAFLRADLRNLPLPDRSVDVTVAVNSILLPSETGIVTAFAEVRRILKPGGSLFGIFPSMDALLYYGHLVLHRELSKAGDDESAVRRAKRVFERRKYDLFRGFYNDDGSCQKLFHPFELRLLLRRSGFGGMRLAKVRYPWGEPSGAFEDFPSDPPMWDWLVRAEAA